MVDQLEVANRKMKISDRCDRCGSQAFVLVTGVNGELMFCGHHFKQHESALNKYAYEIIDERNFLDEKSVSGV
jgi:ribosomal protein S14